MGLARLVSRFLFLFIAFSGIAQSQEIDSLQRVLSSLPADTSKVNTLIRLSRAKSHFSVDSIPRAANAALALADEIHFEEGKIQAYSQLGIYYHHKGNSALAVEFFLDALEICEKINDSTFIADLYNKIGVIYLNQNENNEALVYFNKAYGIWKSQDFKAGLSKALFNIGAIYERWEEDSLALGNYREALKLCVEGDNLKCGILKGIGEIYVKRGQYSESLEYLKKALQYASDVHAIAWVPVIYGAISKAYVAQDKPDEALAAADSSMKYAMQLRSRQFIADGYSYLHKAHEKLKDYPKAYHYQSLYAALNDSLKSVENLNVIEKLRREYELEKKDIEMDLMTYQYEARIFRRNTFIGALVGLLAVVFIVYMRYKANTKRRLATKKTRLTHYTQILLEKSEIIGKISEELSKLKTGSSAGDEDIEKFGQMLNLNINTEDSWEKFKELFEEVYPNFFSMLLYRYPEITPSELRLSAIIKLNLSLKDAAAMLGISPTSVKQGRYRLKKKFNLEDTVTLEEFISGIK